MSSSPSEKQEMTTENQVMSPDKQVMPPVLKRILMIVGIFIFLAGIGVILIIKWAFIGDAVEPMKEQILARELKSAGPFTNVKAHGTTGGELTGMQFYAIAFTSQNPVTLPNSRNNTTKPANDALMTMFPQEAADINGLKSWQVHDDTDDAPGTAKSSDGMITKTLYFNPDTKRYYYEWFRLSDPLKAFTGSKDNSK